MATIPIEVILQDAEAPIVPGEDGTNNTETNIAVPDTGTISDVNNSGGMGSSASIILPSIIAVLTIGAIVAMLVHKHHKHQNDKLSKKEKFATVASSTIAILAATVLVGNLVIPATKAATDDTNTSREGELVVDDKITITVTREADSDEAIVSSIDTKSYATVYKTFGYEVAIAMADNTTNLYLDGDESSDYYFSPVEDGTLADNTWGYTLDGEEYTAMPLIDNLAVVSKGTAPVSNEEVDINYGVKVASDMPAGTYTGEIEYILADTGFPAALRTMQDMTTDICYSVPTPNPFKTDNTTIEDNVPTIMLPDSRDNKLYRVAKLADGKCWMTQNLDLQKENLVAASLDGTNTDNPAEGFTLPVSQTSGNESWGNDETAINTAHIYDLDNNGETYQECLLTYQGSCTEYGDTIPSDTLGNYYNWYAATAGTGTYSLGQGEVAVGSVCPKGWRLPNNSTSQEPTDFSSLFALYGILESSTSKIYDSEKLADSFKAPFFLVKAGGYRNAGVQSVGSSGFIMSSIAGDNTSRINFYYGVGYDDNSFWPWDYQNEKNFGDSVRCLAR